MTEIFKAYDIRGLYPQEITEQFAEKLGRALATQFVGEEIIVGRDGRNGSDKLADALMRGITAQGSVAVNIGLCSTPVLVFAAQESPGVMVTASHNGKEYNGFKVHAKGGAALGLANGLGQLKRLVDENAFVKPKKKGSVKRRDALGKYVAHVRDFKGKLKPLKVVIDAGNSGAGHIAPKVFARLVKVIPLFFELDGSFPNRSPDPGKTGALDALCTAVKQHKAQLGIAYDGDCDRAIFVDEKGKIAPADRILVLLAQQLLKANPHAKVLHDLTCSRVVKEAITKLGGVPVMTRVGTNYIMDAMRDENAIVAGELSGHYYFRDNFFADCGDIAALVLLTLLSEEKKPLSKLLAPLDKYFGSGVINLDVADKAKAMQKAEQEFCDQGKCYNLDGLSAEFPDWWFNVRPSNTENVLRLTVEANTKALLSRKVAELKRLLR